MLTIQHSFFADKKAALQHGLAIPVVCSKMALYQAIAAYLDIDYKGLELTELWAAIDAKNADLACVKAVPKPVLKRDRKPVPKPVLKRGLVVVTNRVYPNQVMAKALQNKGLVIVK